MNRLISVLKKGDELIVKPILRAVEYGERKLYYVYNPKQKIFNKIAKQEYNRLKSYSQFAVKYKNKLNLAETRRLLTNLPLSNVKCRIGRRQIHGTCWFQGIMNGWLLSDKARLFLKARLNAYKKYKNVIQIRGCPSSRKFAPDVFFSYINDYFKGEMNTNQTKYKNENLIPNLSLAQGNIGKGLNGSHVNYSDDNIKNFMKNVFGDNWSFLHPNKDVYLTNKITRVPGYALSHAIIMLFRGNDAHVVTGYTCNGRHVVFDSNAHRYLNIDWRSKRGLEQLKNYYRLYDWKNTSNVHIKYETVVYLRIRPRFLQAQPYFPPKLNLLHVSNKRKKMITGVNSNENARSLIATKGKIYPTSSIGLLKTIYKKKFKRNAPNVINSYTLYHQIKGLPVNANHKLKYEYEIKNKYKNENLNKFIMNKFKRTNKTLSRKNKINILNNFYYDIPWYNEVSLDIWRKAYKLKTGTNAPRHLTNKQIHNLF